MNDDRNLPQVGQVLLGVVKSLSNTEAMVMLPQGLVGHIPRDEISWLRKWATPEEFFTQGQEVNAKVIHVKRSRNGAIIVTLSCRAIAENPWLTVATIHPTNSRANARVVEFLPFGATVQFKSGFQALLHDSEISWTVPVPSAGDKRQKHVRAADFLRIGETIEVVVQRCDTDKRKIWVSHKLTQPCPWDRVANDYPPQSRVVGFVVNIARFGHFVQLPNGCVGLLHSTEAAENALAEYGIGDEIEVIVLSIDQDRRRIALALDVRTLEEGLQRLASPRIFESSDVDAPVTFVEGRRRTAIVNYYERNPKARRACISHHGTCCAVCRMDFAATYGKIGEGFIHVHHLRPVSEIGEVYQLDPLVDLRPVCPNCHAVIHFRTPPFTIEEVTALLRVRNEETKLV